MYGAEIDVHIWTY